MIVYVQGDATEPRFDLTPDNENRTHRHYLVHVVNNRGGFGKGFVTSLSKRWPEPEQDYRKAFSMWNADKPPLGSNIMTPCVTANANVTVVSMVAQDGYRTVDNPVPLCYDKLTECLELLNADSNTVVHMPRIGCGLAGGTWDKVEPLLQEHLCAHGATVIVYDLP